MKCPNDQTTLVISERQNIEIDYCPECRGVWLDRGELDKLIERGQDQTMMPKAEPQRYEQREVRTRSYDEEPHYKKKKKESFLGDIFDF